MPEISVVLIVLLAIAVIVGVIAGWVIRGNRAELEKAAVGIGWQEQIEAQRKEHERLSDQNKGLMEQVSQFQASHADAKNRAKELSIAVQEAFERRDELQREIKDIRGNLEVVVNERKQLQSNIDANSVGEDTLREKDERIQKLTQELEGWQNRLPPLIEKFRERNEAAASFEQELADARERIYELESSQPASASDQTRIEAVHDSDELTDGLDASNDPAEDEWETEEEVEADVEEDAEDEDDVEDEQEVAEIEEEFEDDEDEVEQEPEVDAATHRDNLKKIKGVGPAIEKTLNEIGIVNFQQIADMSEYDIDRVAKRLKGFHSRIYREDWIGQARTLLDQAVQA